MIELTKEQIERQNDVDNLIYLMLRGMVNDDEKLKELPWDIEEIGSIRDVVKHILCDVHKIMTEQQFYPYIVIPKTIIEVRGGCVVNISTDILEQSFIIKDYDNQDEPDNTFYFHPEPLLNKGGSL